MKRLAIIPARCGSKGVKDKNIKFLNGKPLLVYAIESAQASGLFDEIMVSTDSPQYADIAKSYGANVPFLRSEINSSDLADSWDMVAEVLSQYAEKSQFFDSFCLLQPTSPFRTQDDIIKAYNLFDEKAGVAVVSVCETEHSPLWSGRLDKTASLDGFISESSAKNRQSDGQFYRINGAIYIFNVKEFERNHYPYRKGSYAYIMKQETSIDIDTEMDFKFAEFLAKEMVHLNEYV